LVVLELVDGRKDGGDVGSPLVLDQETVPYGLEEEICISPLVADLDLITWKSKGLGKAVWDLLDGLTFGKHVLTKIVHLNSW
jgi:hypothetical protein